LFAFVRKQVIGRQKQLQNEKRHHFSLRHVLIWRSDQETRDGWDE
jgi:hypothetical protein